MKTLALFLAALTGLGLAAAFGWALNNLNQALDEYDALDEGLVERDDSTYPPGSRRRDRPVS